MSENHVYVGMLSEPCSNCGVGSAIIGGATKLGVRIRNVSLCYTCISTVKALVDYAVGAISLTSAKPDINTGSSRRTTP